MDGGRSTKSDDRDDQSEKFPTGREIGDDILDVKSGAPGSPWPINSISIEAEPSRWPAFQ
jgi:hypothetical protein